MDWVRGAADARRILEGPHPISRQGTQREYSRLACGHPVPLRHGYLRGKRMRKPPPRQPEAPTAREIMSALSERSKLPEEELRRN
jgi:hypothetical protein